MSLFKEFWKNRSEIGSIAPSSPFLTSKMLKPIDFSKNIVVVEYGPGTGALTLPILKKMNPSSLLISIESNQRLHDKLKVIEKDHTNLKVFHTSAEKIDFVLASLKIPLADYIISSLPLAVMEASTRAAVVKNAFNYLSNDGLYIQYQYSLDAHELLSSIFGQVKCGLSIINIPPAFIYYCSK